ncbi:MAG: class I SAM-dependent methyltransferase [bacterium]|nr:MAG: class I SAM-dependent methyltransferase [bacterium]
MESIHYHFTQIASKYGDLRTTDEEPILFIRELLEDRPVIRAADIGCGVGRYVVRFFHHFGNRLYLACIDSNECMLDTLRSNLTSGRIRNFSVIRARAGAIPLPSDSLDCVMTFNAVHHFRLMDFLEESSRVLVPGGFLVIYTRLRSQNRKNIWGRYFPGFSEKEKRLYELDELKSAIKKVKPLKLRSIEFFRFNRTATLEELLRRAANHHYSTFHLYEEREFAEALEGFERNVLRTVENPGEVFWRDLNVMLVMRRVKPQA